MAFIAEPVKVLFGTPQCYNALKFMMKEVCRKDLDLGFKFTKMVTHSKATREMEFLAGSYPRVNFKAGTTSVTAGFDGENLRKTVTFANVGQIANKKADAYKLEQLSFNHTTGKWSARINGEYHIDKTTQEMRELIKHEKKANGVNFETQG